MADTPVFHYLTAEALLDEAVKAEAALEHKRVGPNELNNLHYSLMRTIAIAQVHATLSTYTGILPSKE